MAKNTQFGHERNNRKKAGRKAATETRRERSLVHSTMNLEANKRCIARVKAVLAHPCYVPAKEEPGARDFYTQALEWLEGHPRRRLTLATVKILSCVEYKLEKGEKVYGFVYITKKVPTVLADFMTNPALLPMKPPGKKP
jgi:hypothetical protein